MSTRLAVAGIALLVPLTASAQWLNYPTPGVPRLPDGKANLAAPAPCFGVSGCCIGFVAAPHALPGPLARKMPLPPTPVLAGAGVEPAPALARMLVPSA